MNPVDCSHMISKQKGVDCACFGRHSNPFLIEAHMLTVIGSAECLASDIESTGIHGDVAVVNDMALHCPVKYNHIVSGHPDVLQRILRNLPAGEFQTHTLQNVKRKDPGFAADFEWSIKVNGEYRGYPSSGLLAAWLGLLMGYKKIILLGIPLDASPLYYSGPGGCDYTKFIKKLLELKEFFKNVRSASGKTADILGKVTDNFLKE